MTTPAIPQVDCERHHPSLSVSDVLAAADFYIKKLGFSLGDGVASPHTKGQLRYIQELKKKHGIDYDSHGSYRFVEE
jgi:catechol 2,3-dioxygenase-like lactoylglutathione lyase family enzyme